MTAPPISLATIEITESRNSNINSVNRNLLNSQEHAQGVSVSVIQKIQNDLQNNSLKRDPLLVSFANDISMYFKIDISLEISKLEEFIEESFAKLEELMILYDMMESETKEWSITVLPPLITESQKNLTYLRSRLNSIEALIKTLKKTLEQLEIQIAEAEQAMGTSSSSLRSVLNYFHRKPESHSHPPDLSASKPPSFDEIRLLDIDKYFATMELMKKK